MLSTKPKHIIIAHGGGDGVCAASIAVLKLPDPIDIYFSQSYMIKSLIKKLLRTEQHDKVRIYILDIHINASVIELLKKFNRVVYIDHHHHSIKHKAEFPGNIDKYNAIYSYKHNAAINILNRVGTTQMSTPVEMFVRTSMNQEALPLWMG